MDNLRSPRLEWELARLSRRGAVFAADWIHSFSQTSRPYPLPGPDITFAGDGELDRAARRIALALAALGSYIVGALLMLADRGPQVMGGRPSPRLTRYDPRISPYGARPVATACKRSGAVMNEILEHAACVAGDTNLMVWRDSG